MTTFCKLKDGREMIVFSDNTDERTMHVFPVDEFNHYDAEYLQCEEVPYSDILRTDTNRIIAYA